MEDMVGDALDINLSYDEGVELKFYSMMEKVNKLLFEGSSDLSAQVKEVKNGIEKQVLYWKDNFQYF